MDKIIINKLECFGKHGVFKEENVLGQKFLISAEMLVEKAQNDDLDTSVNYGEVAWFIQDIVQDNVFKLIETLAEAIANGLLKAFAISEVTIRVEKPWAPVGLPLESVGVEIKRSWHKAYISFGSNMGDKEDYISKAIEEMKANKSVKINKVSTIIETKPYGGVEQDNFLNGCMEISTILAPEELLDYLHTLEANANRVREIHWGPRTLDLDIVFYDNEVIYTENLIVPHIDMQNRDFVLKPMAEIAPYMIHPILNKTMLQLLAELGGGQK